MQYTYMFRAFCSLLVLSRCQGQGNAQENEISPDTPKSDEIIQSACSGTPAVERGERGFFTSPGFTSGGYPNNVMCQWLVVVPSGKAQLYFHEFRLESSRSCLFDSIRVHDGPSTNDRLINRYCGSDSLGPIVGSTNSLTIAFSSDFIGSSLGFNITYASSDMVGPPVDACSGSAASLGGSQGAFVSPGYLAGSYPDNSVCVWSVTVPSGRVRLTFTEFDIEGPGTGGGCRDVVVIRDGLSITGLGLGTACGHGEPNEVISSTNSLTLSFASNSQIAKTGFRAEYYEIGATETGSGLLGCNGQIFRLDQPSGLFTSPGYFFGSYPNSYTCRYQITVPRELAGLQLLNFNLEQSADCTNDYFEVYNGHVPAADSLIGRYCGTTVPSQGIVGSSDQFFVIFRSNNAVISTGFAALYMSTSPAPPAPGSSGASAVVGQVPQSAQLPPAPPPAPASPGSTSVQASDGLEIRIITRGVEETCLAAHNKVRALHKDTGPLVYDSGLARGAEDWAKELADTDLFRHSDTGLGENLFYGSTTVTDSLFTPTQAVFQWYSEYKYYDYGTGQAIPGKSFTDVGHFTQVVWRNTLRLGCGVATVFRNNRQRTYIVSRYAPPGNFMGLFDMNVLTLKDGAVQPTTYTDLSV